MNGEGSYKEHYVKDLGVTPDVSYRFGKSYFPFLANLVGENPGGKVLDIGCGWGGQAAVMVESGWNVQCVDKEKAFIEDNPFSVLRGRLTHCNLQDLPKFFTPGMFTIIHAHMVLEHLQPVHVIPALQTLRSLLKPWGLLIAIYKSKENDEGKDKTHYCLWSEGRWNTTVSQNGFDLQKHLVRKAQQHPKFQADWNIIIAKKQSIAT